MSILNELGSRMLFFDGGMGTMLQKRGSLPGEMTELWNIKRPEDVKDVHLQYLEAGADIVTANTFGASEIKLAGSGYTPEDVVTAGIRLAKEATDSVRTDGRKHSAYVAMDISSTGRLLKPLGTLEFDQAYEAFKTMAAAGEKAGADLALIETMTDTYELKAAVLAVKENTHLPLFVTVTFDEKGKLLTGADVGAVVTLLEGLGADAIGINCGLGPVQMRPLIKRMLELTSLPVIANPNAGLPRQIDGETVYDITPQQFAEQMELMAGDGVWLMGGCCGTTPEYIRLIKERCGDITPGPIEKKHFTRISSYSRSIDFDKGHVIIGERINPTGKKLFKQALINEYYKMSNISKNFKTQNFNTLDLSLFSDDIIPELNISSKQNILEISAICEMFVQNFTKDNEENLLFYGDTGLGKTFMSNCIAKALLDKGFTVIYQTSFKMFEIIEEYKFHNINNSISKENYNNLFECDLLIIDDLGTELTNTFTVSELFMILNTRLLNKKKTIISTNFSLGKLAETYTERISSRIFDKFTLVKFVGKDLRWESKFD